MPGLHAIIDTTPDVCTGMLVDRFLRGRQRPWAVVAAFGDNLADQARALGASAGIAAPQLTCCRNWANASTTTLTLTATKISSSIPACSMNMYVATGILGLFLQ
jgi:hypothetical protein